MAYGKWMPQKSRSPTSNQSPVSPNAATQIQVIEPASKGLHLSCPLSVESAEIPCGYATISNSKCQKYCKVFELSNRSLFWVPGLLSTVLNMWCVRPLTFIHHHVGVTENWIGYDRVHQFQANSSFPIFSVASLHSKTLRLSGHSVTLSKAMEVLSSQAMRQAKLSQDGTNGTHPYPSKSYFAPTHHT